jgi:hypothetical protein
MINTIKLTDGEYDCLCYLTSLITNEDRERLHEVIRSGGYARLIDAVCSFDLRADRIGGKDDPASAVVRYLIAGSRLDNSS